ncbi:MAG: hypothetical protein HFG20_11625 [Anaerotruncus sp.]|nr:hypothetical protein [Anaerotruncus sp.]
MSILRNFLRVQLPPEQALQIFRFLQDDTEGIGSIDFDKIDPMPPWVFGGAPTPESERKYGAENCQPQWRMLHWGCAHNAIHPQDNAAAYDFGNAIQFDTEGSDVRILVHKLSLIFKPPQFDYLWADEDIGRSCGMLGYRDGVCNYEVLPQPHSRRAYELSFDILGGRPEEYGMVYDPQRNNYVYTGNTTAVKIEQPDRRDVKLWQPARKSSGAFAGAAQSHPIGQRPAKSSSTVKTG